MSIDVLVLGGGVSGLAAAYLLKRQGMQVLVVEKEAEIGGRTQTLAFDGFSTDAAAQFLTNFFKRTLSLVESLGISNHLIPVTAPNGIITGNQIHGLRPVPLLVGDLLPWPSKLRLLGVMLEVWYYSRLLDFDDIVKSAPLDTESVLDLVHRRLDTATLNRFLAPLLRGFWYWQASSTTRAMLYDYLRHFTNPRLFTLAGGMGELPSALAAHLDIIYEAPAVRSRYDSASQSWQTLAGDGESGRVIESKAVLCTLPAPHVNAIFATLPASIKAFFAQIGYTTNIITHLGLDRRFDLAGYYQFFYLPAEVKDVAAVTIRSNKVPSQTPPGKDVISVFPSSEFSREVAPKSDEAIVEMIVAQLGSLYPFSALPLAEAVVAARVVREQQALPRFEVGSIQRLRDFETDLVKDLPPGLFFAGDFIGGPSVEQAIASAERAAPRIQKFLQGF